jgi:hypothetical protein
MRLTAASRRTVASVASRPWLRPLMRDVRLERSLVHRRVLRFRAITTAGVLCVHRSAPAAARELPRGQLRQALLSALFGPALGCRLNGRARRSNAVPCTGHVRPSGHGEPPRYTGDFTSLCQLSTAELRLRPVPNFSSSGRAVSGASSLGVRAARRSTRR